MNDRFWHTSYGTIPTEIDPDAYPSVVSMLEEAMVTFADQPAFKCLGQTVSYADIDHQSRAFAAYLQNKLGIQKGDRIAVMMPNFIAFPIAFLGIARAGAIQVNVNPLYAPGELEHQLNDAGVTVIIVFNGVSGTVAEVIPNTSLKTIITVTPGDGTSAKLPGPPVDARIVCTIAFADCLIEGSEIIFNPVKLIGENLLFLQYTGGTTGLSKGAALTHRNLVANVAQFKAFMPDIRPGHEVVVTAIPLYHIFALMVNFISYFSAGAENWLVPNPRDFDSFIDVMKMARPTVFTGVNTLFNGLVSHPRSKEIDFSRLRLAIGGGAAIIETTSAKWQALTGIFIREGYGLSETSPVLSFNPASVTAFNGSTGLPMPSTDIKLITHEGLEAKIGEPGEICAKGPQVMSGYWNQPKADATSFTNDGYFRTGDVGVFDEHGFLKIIDRTKDMIIVSGFKVFPNEVEAIASGCPGVLECACIGVPDKKTGEAVKLFIVRLPNSSLAAAEITRFFHKKLTPYKIPKQIEFVETLPKSSVGKILRRELRNMASA
jgi:long-chain acyl-CoA synthetase